jgi:hypothetical protein
MHEYIRELCHDPFTVAQIRKESQEVRHRRHVRNFSAKNHIELNVERTSNWNDYSSTRKSGHQQIESMNGLYARERKLLQERSDRRKRLTDLKRWDVYRDNTRARQNWQNEMIHVLARNQAWQALVVQTQIALKIRSAIDENRVARALKFLKNLSSKKIGVRYRKMLARRGTTVSDRNNLALRE